MQQAEESDELSKRKRSLGENHVLTAKTPGNASVLLVDELPQRPKNHRRSYTEPTELLLQLTRFLSEEDCQNNCKGINDKIKVPPGEEKDNDKDVDKEGINGVDALTGALTPNRGPRRRCALKASLSAPLGSTRSRSRSPSMVGQGDRRGSETVSLVVPRRGSIGIGINLPRRTSISPAPRRNINARRSSEIPGLTTIARTRRSQPHQQPLFPVASYRRRGSKPFVSTDFGRSHFKELAKHEMLAHLMLPPCLEVSSPRSERRVTCHGPPATMLQSKEEKRLHVAKEIVETERKYLSCLLTIHKVFEEPLREACILSSKEIDIIFPKQLSKLRESHSKFVQELEERLKHWKWHGILGDIFAKLSSSYNVDILKTYTSYVNNFPKAIAAINKHSRHSQKFRRFLQTSSRSPLCEGLDLSAFLLTPIQRLPRYVLLLRQLSKYTDSCHPDRFHLDNTLEKMKQMINILNDSIQSSCRLASDVSSRQMPKRRRPGKKKLSSGRIIITQARSHQLEEVENTTVLTVSSPIPSSDESQVDALTQADNVSSEKTEENQTSESFETSSPGSWLSLKKTRPLSTSDIDNIQESTELDKFTAISEERLDDSSDDQTSKTFSKFRMVGNALIMIGSLRRKKSSHSAEPSKETSDSPKIDSPKTPCDVTSNDDTSRDQQLRDVSSSSDSTDGCVMNKSPTEQEIDVFTEMNSSPKELCNTPTSKGNSFFAPFRRTWSERRRNNSSTLRENRPQSMIVTPTYCAVDIKHERLNSSDMILESLNVQTNEDKDINSGIDKQVQRPPLRRATSEKTPGVSLLQFHRQHKLNNNGLDKPRPTSLIVTSTCDQTNNEQFRARSNSEHERDESKPQTGTRKFNILHPLRRSFSDLNKRKHRIPISRTNTDPEQDNTPPSSPGGIVKPLLPARKISSTLDSNESLPRSRSSSDSEYGSLERKSLRGSFRNANILPEFQNLDFGIPDANKKSKRSFKESVKHLFINKREELTSSDVVTTHRPSLSSITSLDEFEEIITTV